MTYRKGTDSATVFFNKIEKMVDRVLLHKWNKQELMTYFLTHCVEDVSIRTQIFMQEAKVPDSIKTVIEKMEHIKTEVQPNEIALLQQKRLLQMCCGKNQISGSQIVSNKQGSPDRN